MIVIRQLTRSAMSIGANVTEATNSSTRKEFKRYYEIALKSGSETKYWIRIHRDAFEVQDDELTILMQEAYELCRILGASVIKLKSNP
jgi:four helix bundle protein